MYNLFPTTVAKCKLIKEKYTKCKMCANEKAAL